MDTPNPPPEYLHAAGSLNLNQMFLTLYAADMKDIFSLKAVEDHDFLPTTLNHCFCPSVHKKAAFIL